MRLGVFFRLYAQTGKKLDELQEIDAAEHEGNPGVMERCVPAVLLRLLGLPGSVNVLVLCTQALI
jgi:hypothetical protein